MPISVEWGDEAQQVILITFQGDWTWETRDVAMSEVEARLDTVNHQVDIIFDLRGSERPPTGIGSQLEYLRQMPVFTHPNACSLIMVGPNPFYKTLIQIIGELFSLGSGKLVFAKTMGEALDLAGQCTSSDQIGHAKG